MMVRTKSERGKGMKISLDIGGSKTRLTVYDGNATSAFVIRGGFGLAQDSHEILSELKNGMEALLGKDLMSVTRVIVNLGGKNTEQITRTVKAVLGEVPVEVYRESGGQIALHMMRLYESNIVIMAGTGCIAFGAEEDKRCVIGGWGKEIGDTGCGYSLGMSAIQQTLIELDSSEASLSEIAKRISGRETPLVFDRFESYAAARDAVRARLPKSREGVAALTRQVVACAEAGCPTARRLCERVGEEIGHTAVAVAQKIGAKSVRVVVNGGMTAFSALWVHRTEQVIGAELPLEAMKVTNDGIQSALDVMMEESQ